MKKQKQRERAGRRREHRYGYKTWYFKHYVSLFVDTKYEEMKADFRKRFNMELPLNKSEVKAAFNVFINSLFNTYFMLLHEKRMELMIHRMMYIYWNKRYFLYNIHKIKQKKDGNIKSRRGDKGQS